MRTIVPLDRTMQLPLTLAGSLRTTFADVVSSPIPERLARLCADYMPTAPNAQGRRATMGQAQHKSRAVLIVEDDVELRSLTAALFEDEQMDIIECESAEAALATLLISRREVTMILADIRLRGVMDGIDLAREVKLRWPLLPVILTSGLPRDRVGHLPLGVGYMAKPWQPLDVLIAAKQALASEPR